MKRKREPDSYSIESNVGHTKFRLIFREKAERDRLWSLMNSGGCAIELRMEISTITSSKINGAMVEKTTAKRS